MLMISIDFFVTPHLCGVFVSRRAFVSEGAAKAAGLRRDDSLGGDASASSPEANCLVVNRESDLPQPQFS